MGIQIQGELGTWILVQGWFARNVVAGQMCTTSVVQLQIAVAIQSCGRSHTSAYDKVPEYLGT